jgi:hypothetical protein
LAHAPSPTRLAIAGSIFAVSVIGFMAVLLSTQGQPQSGLIAQASGLVILEPDDWIGDEFPIAAHIDLDLSQGHWTVLLHRHDCPKCLEELPKYEQLAHKEAVALIEVPPFKDSIRSNGGVARYGRLSDDRDWFVQTPVELILEDGSVVATAQLHE